MSYSKPKLVTTVSILPLLLGLTACENKTTYKEITSNFCPNTIQLPATTAKAIQFKDLIDGRDGEYRLVQVDHNLLAKSGSKNMSYTGQTKFIASTDSERAQNKLTCIDLSQFPSGELASTIQTPSAFDAKTGKVSNYFFVKYNAAGTKTNKTNQDGSSYYAGIESNAVNLDAKNPDQNFKVFKIDQDTVEVFSTSEKTDDKNQRLITKNRYIYKFKALVQPQTKVTE